MIGKARDAMATQQLHQVLNAVWAVVADANRYFAGEAPWALAKTDPQRQGTVLYVTAEVLRQIAILAQPFMPEFGAKTARSSGGAGRASARSLSLGGKHRIAAGVNCRHRRRYSRVMSSRRKAANEQMLDRQPLPSRFSRFRRRARRRGRSRARVPASGAW